MASEALRTAAPHAQLLPFAAGVGRMVAVGLYPAGRSPFGIDDVAGNVYEWCLNE